MDLSRKVLKSSENGINIKSMARYPPGTELFHSLQTQTYPNGFICCINEAEKSLALTSCS